jgi:hypothetical protein|tara:strand:+ start:180 stop:644 length:465 start_codon:yes stop_codon:yes gene_type:complete
MKTQYPKLQIIELDKAFIELLEGNVVLLKFKEDGIFELRDAIEANKAIYSIVKGKPFLSLVDARVYGSISADAREFFAKDTLTKDIKVAEAIVIDNLPSRLFAKFYIRLSRPANPVKIFSDINVAELWLQLQQKNRFREVFERDMSFHEKFKNN